MSMKKTNPKYHNFGLIPRGSEACASLTSGLICCKSDSLLSFLIQTSAEIPITLIFMHQVLVSAEKQNNYIHRYMCVYTHTQTHIFHQGLLSTKQDTNSSSCHKDIHHCHTHKSISHRTGQLNMISLVNYWLGKKKSKMISSIFFKNFLQIVALVTFLKLQCILIKHQ